VYSWHHLAFISRGHIRDFGEKPPQGFHLLGKKVDGKVRVRFKVFVVEKVELVRFTESYVLQDRVDRAFECQALHRLYLHDEGGQVLSAVEKAGTVGDGSAHGESSFGKMVDNPEGGGILQLPVEEALSFGTAFEKASNLTGLGLFYWPGRVWGKCVKRKRNNINLILGTQFAPACQTFFLWCYNIFMKNYSDRPTFSKNLIRFRKERKLTQGELAQMAGLSKRMITYYETKAVKPPVDKIGIIAKILNVSVDELLGLHEPTAIQKELINIDGRTLKRLKKILALSTDERHLVYSFVDSLLIKKERKGK
jgi:transcriptional regulator with XRE-family HTH domain